MMKRDKGFTLLEVMIAIVIFGFLMAIVSQLMRSEIRMFNTASHQNEIEHKARTAMVHILDEIRLNRYTYYSPGTGSYDAGVYTSEPGQPTKCLIDINPNPVVQTGDSSALPAETKIYYDSIAKQLWYRDTETDTVHLIADKIDSIAILPVTEHLLQIYLKAGDDSGDSEHELLTWVRLY